MCFKEQVGEVIVFYAVVVSGSQSCYPKGKDAPDLEYVRRSGSNWQ